MKSNPSSQQIEQLALRQLRDYQSNTPGMCFSEPGFNINVDAAYDLQDAVTRLRVKAGENVIGYKVGCTGPGTKAQFGMNGPIRGTLFGNEAFRNDAVINPNEFCQLAIEGEMAVKVGIDGQIEAAFPVIELHNFIFRAEQKTLSELIANNGINAGIILPEKDCQNSTKYLCNDAQLTLFINGLVIGTTGLWPNGDGPEASVNWLKDNLEDCCIELEPGSIVLAGTALGLYPVKNGDEVTVHIDGQPIVSCTIKSSCTL
jgi:2-keto-4-pentenoate hydratase